MVKVSSLVSKVSDTLRWIFGVFFLIGGVFTITSNGIIAILMAGVLIPWSYKYLKGAYKKLSGKEIPMYVGIILFVILLLVFGATSTQTTANTPNPQKTTPTVKKEIPQNIPVPTVVPKPTIDIDHIYSNLLDSKIVELEKKYGIAKDKIITITGTGYSINIEPKDQSFNEKTLKYTPIQKINQVPSSITYNLGSDWKCSKSDIIKDSDRIIAFLGLDGAQKGELSDNKIILENGTAQFMNAFGRKDLDFTINCWGDSYSVMFAKLSEDEVARQEREKNREARKEEYKKCFSAWDGSHTNLTRAIKESMNDPGSYEHVDTTFSDNGSEIIVLTKFRGKNGFGAKVLNVVKASTDIDCNVIKILSE